MRSLLVTALVLGLSGTAIAQPSVPIAPRVQTSLVEVQYGGPPGYRRPPGYRPGYGPGYRPGYGPGYRPGYRPPPGYYGGGYYNNGYNNGGAVAAGLISGLLIGGMLGAAASQQNQSAYNAHVAWCAQTYRSYRASDNTFQPYNGPRQPCASPY